MPIFKTKSSNVNMSLFQTLLRHKITAWLWWLLIWIGCSLPGKELPKLGLFDHFDKLVHFVFFFVLVMLFRFSLSWHKLKILLFALCNAILIEIYQKYFVAGRSFDVWDIVADATGAFLAFLVFAKKQ